VFAFLAEQRWVLFAPQAFADMYAPVNGRPSVPPDLLATVVVLQALHGLSDEEALAALRFERRHDRSVVTELRALQCAR
jgi:hypothetical protein